MSCYLTVDANGTITRNYVGDTTIQLTSANDGGSSYVPPVCNSSPHTPSHSVPEPSGLALLAIGLLALSVKRARIRD